MENRRSRLLFQQPWFENHGHHLFHHFSRSRFMISLVGWSKNWFTDPAANVVNCPRERNEITTGSLRNDRDKFRPQPLQHPLSDDQFPSHHPSINWSTLSLFFPREPSRSLQRELTRRPWTRNFSIAPKFLQVPLLEKFHLSARLFLRYDSMRKSCFHIFWIILADI